MDPSAPTILRGPEFESQAQHLRFDFSIYIEL